MSAHPSRTPPRDPSQSRTPPRDRDRRRRPSPSPIPRRGRRGRDTETRVVREVGAANYPMLTRTNYVEWVVLMEVMLEAREL